MTNKTSISVSSAKRRAHKLRLVGLVVLLLGIAGGIMVYECRLRTSDVMDDPEMLGFNRAEIRQMGLLYGRQGTMIMEFNAALERPQTQVILILILSALVAGGCWMIARLMERDGK